MRPGVVKPRANGEVAGAVLTEFSPAVRHTGGVNGYLPKVPTGRKNTRAPPPWSALELSAYDPTGFNKDGVPGSLAGWIRLSGRGKR